MNKFKFLTAWQLLRNRVRTVNFRKGSPERQLVADFAITFGGVYLFMTSVVGITICVGPSMLPTIDAAGELAFVDRLSYKLDMKDYKIGDVVISKSMDDPRKTVCKRIKGVAGDMVYFKHKNRDPMLLQVPEGHVWLLGDNTANSNDSRYYGPVPLGMLEGRIFFKIGLNPLRAGSLDAAATKVENGPSTKLKETSEVNETQETKETKENADLIERRNVGNNS